MKIYTLLLLLLCTGFGILNAQDTDDELSLMQKYSLPQQAVKLDSLQKDSLTVYQGMPFTGTAYSLYSTGKLRSVEHFDRGKPHGLMYVWYPDGKPQLLAHYKHGYLNGRFTGWYQYGGVIYDLVMNDGRLGDDAQLDEDSSRATGDREEGGRDADAKVQDNGE